MLYWLCLCSIDNSKRSTISSNTVVELCSFIDIRNELSGGVMFCSTSVDIVVKSSVFQNCHGSYAGVMYFQARKAIIMECLLSECSSTGHIGGIYCCLSDTSNISCVSLYKCSSAYRLIWWECNVENSVNYLNHSQSYTPCNEITTGSGSSPMNYHYILMDSCSNPSCGGILYFMSGRISLEYLTVINCIFGTGEGLILLAGGSQTIARYAFVKNCTSSYYIKYYTGGGTITFYNSIIYENQYLTVSKYNILTVGTPYFEMKCGSKIDFHSPSNIARFPRLIMYFITFITSNL